MKRIGLVGGIGWASTLEYYRMINQFASEKLGSGHSADLVLVNLNAGVIRELAAQGNEHEIYQMILKASQTVEHAGAGLFALCANGAHRFHDQLKEKINIPMVHLVDATTTAIKKTGIQKVGLLGIQKTMEGSFYQAILKKQGIETIIPNLEDREFLDRTIYEELMNEQFLPATKQRYLEIMNGLVQQGAEGVILGCTEIPLLIQPKDFANPLFSTTEIHCRAIVEAAFSK